MSLTIISTLLGILSSTLPSIFRYLERKQDLRQQVELARIQAEAASVSSKAQKNLESIKSASIEGDNLRNHDNLLDGGEFVNALRASVRPIVTYVFFLLFCMVKIMVAMIVFSEGINIENMKEALDLILDENTIAIFSMILGFWFGGRSLERLLAKDK